MEVAVPEFEDPPVKPAPPLRCPAPHEGWAHAFESTSVNGKVVIFCANCGEVRELVPPFPHA